MRRSVLTLILLSSLTFLAGLGRQAITDADEAFYAEAAREMLESGDWLTPHFNYQHRWEKPVLYYWLASALYGVAGASEAAARGPAALSGVALVLLTWAVARRTSNPIPDDRRSIDGSAWLAAAIVATCFGYFAEARMALPDLPLALFITLTIWAALRAAESSILWWWMIAGTAAGLGFLTKGPVAIVLPAIVLLPIWWFERRRFVVNLSGVATAVIVAALVGLPWYAAMWRVHGTEYLRVFFLENNVQRFATEEYNGARPVWFYLPIVLGGLVPWSAYLGVFATRVGRSSENISTTHVWRDLWFVVWLAMPLLFYTVSIGKQPRYILPILPPLAILLARGMTRCCERSADPAAARALAIGTWITAALLATAALLLGRAQVLLVNAFAAVTWIAVIALALSALVLGSIVLRRTWTMLPATLACLSAIFLLSIQFGALAGRRPEAVEDMAALVRANRPAGERVAEYHAFVRNLVFYLGFKQEDELFTPEQARAFLQSSERVLLVATRRDAADLQASAAIPLRVLGEVRYLNTANLKLRDVLAPDPGRTIETVVLVSNR